MKIDNTYFRDYKKESIELFKNILQTCGQDAFDEQALPAYTNPNPLMRYLFWQRVKYAMQYISGLEKCTVCLDFGCGLGAMIPFLINKSQSVIAVDLDVSLLERLGEEKNWTNVQYFSKLTHLENYLGKVDLIIVMDVLEHVDDLNEVLRNFNDLLSLNGSILVSGPTENLLYKIGRKLANYSGEYHTSNIHDIVSQLGKLFTIHRYKTLFPVFDFFELYIAKKGPATLSSVKY